MSLVHVRKGRSESGNISDSIQDEHFDSSNEGAGEESDYSNRSDTEGSEGAEDQEERRVDDDEDRSNPQYIPKRGTFYEHDDRTASGRDDENQDGGDAPGGDGSDASGGGEAGRGERETPTEPRRQRAPRKSDTCDKWSHDKYNENDQTPKSRDELVAIYGYDIRNEDGPPHARRVRRYGRGPNKYTRTWEDEEAYRRASAATPAVRKPPPSTGEEDFPALDKTPARKVKKSKSGRPASRPNVENGGGDRQHRAPAAKNATAGPKLPIENLTISTTVNNSSNQSRKVTASNTPRSPQLNQAPSPRENAQPAHNNTQPMRRTVQPQLTIPQQQQPPSQQQQQHQAPPTTGPAQLHQQKPPTPQQLIPPHLPGKQSVPHQQAQGQAVAGQQQHSGGGEGGRGKRYSSLRQRPLVEGYAPQAAPPVQATPTTAVSQPAPPTQQAPAQQHRYVAEYQGGPGQQPAHQASPVPQMQLQQQQMMHQQVHPVPQTQQGPPQQHPQQVLARGIPILTPQEAQLVAPQHAVHTHAMTGQLAMMPAQYIQGGTSAVYAAPPPPAVYAQPAPPYPHQMYPHHNYTPHRTTPSATGTSPGITYYGPADHQLAGEARPQRRPTAAIPIVPPPPPAAKSGSGQQDKESIDRIVDNMFVRKQRPQGTAFSGADTAKSQIEQKSRAASEGSKRSQDSSSKESSHAKSSSPPDSLSSSLVSTDSRQSADKSTEHSSEPHVETRELEKSVEKVKETEPAEMVTSTSEKEPAGELNKSADVAEGAKEISNPSKQQTEVSSTGETKEIV